MLEFDEIGYWSEIKLEIIKKYANAYSKILNKQHGFTHIYIDAFSGPGVNISKTTGEMVEGSPINALYVTPPFKEYHFIDLDGDKMEFLRNQVGDMANVKTYHGDCNGILIEKIFPNCCYTDFKRALCLLDPYRLQLKWEVIAKAAELGTIEIFLNFPIMVMNRTAIWRDYTKVPESNIKRMNSFWGDESWRDAAYREVQTLFGPVMEKTQNIVIAKAFKKRLKEVAGFSYIPEPIPMRNTIGSIIYYLFFAAHKPVSNKIVENIFDKYRNKGVK